MGQGSKGAGRSEAVHWGRVRRSWLRFVGDAGCPRRRDRSPVGLPAQPAERPKEPGGWNVDIVHDAGSGTDSAFLYALDPFHSCPAFSGPRGRPCFHHFGVTGPSGPGGPGGCVVGEPASGLVCRSVRPPPVPLLVRDRMDLVCGRCGCSVRRSSAGGPLSPGWGNERTPSRPAPGTLKHSWPFS